MERKGGVTYINVCDKETKDTRDEFSGNFKLRPHDRASRFQSFQTPPRHDCLNRLSPILIIFEFPDIKIEIPPRIEWIELGLSTEGRIGAMIVIFYSTLFLLYGDGDPSDSLY